MEKNSARFETVWTQNGHSASLANAQIRRREFANMLAETKLRAESETSFCPLMSSAIVIFETPTPNSHSEAFASMLMSINV